MSSGGNRWGFGSSHKINLLLVKDKSHARLWSQEVS